MPNVTTAATAAPEKVNHRDRRPRADTPPDGTSIVRMEIFISLLAENGCEQFPPEPNVNPPHVRFSDYAG